MITYTVYILFSVFGGLAACYHNMLACIFHTLDLLLLDTPESVEP